MCALYIEKKNLRTGLVLTIRVSLLRIWILEIMSTVHSRISQDQFYIMQIRIPQESISEISYPSDKNNLSTRIKILVLGGKNKKYIWLSFSQINFINLHKQAVKSTKR